MKCHFLLLWALVLVISSTAFPLTSHLVNRIEGQVFSPDRLPVQNAYVELIDEVNSVVAQTKTNSSGRFTFTGMSGGRYVIKVLPFGTEFKEQSQEVYVISPTRGSSDIVYTDFYLIYDKRSGTLLAGTSPEAVFVQEIPPVAKKLYDDGASTLKKNQSEGFVKIEQAIKIFPNYFDALNLLGEKYISLNNYEKAYPYLIRAIEINPRSSINFYRLGFAFYQLKQYPAALEAARGATILVPNSIDAQLLYGTTLRVNEKYEDAEKVLLKANSLANGKNSEVHWQLALIYNRLNRNLEAISELETFLKVAPKSPDKNKILDLIAKLKASASNSK